MWSAFNYLLRVAVLIIAASLTSVVVEGKYKFQVQVRDFDDPVDDCGGGADRCVLYIDDMCLSPLPEPGSEEGGEDEECSLGERSSDIDIESGLPRTVSINSDTTQPWPVDFQLYMEIKDNDFLSDDDHIDDIEFSLSLNTSSDFTSTMLFSGRRITIHLKFRVCCTGDYEGPHCDCIPRDDDINGHYSCREEGGISCLPGYTNTSNLCRQRDYCSGVECPPNAECIGNSTSHNICRCPEGTDCDPRNTTSTTSTTTTTASPNVTGCDCDGNSMCTDGVGRCECPEGFTGETCSTPVDRASPRPRSQSGQDPALSGAAIASVVVALLLTAVACGLLVMVFVCIRLRKKRNVDVALKPKSAENGTTPSKYPLSPTSIQSQLITNPTYGHVSPVTTDNGSLDGGDDNGSLDGGEGTLRNMDNPLYDDHQVENPLYTDSQLEITAEETIYSIPRRGPGSDTGEGEGGGGEGGGEGGIYTDPDSPRSGETGDDNEYSYAVVGGDDDGGSGSVDGNEYATATAPPHNTGEDPLYNTLDHGIVQPQQRQTTVAPSEELSTEYDTLTYHTH